jgi:hypothetical protein
MRPMSVLAAAALTAVFLAAPGAAVSPRFYSDDPLEIDDDRALDASGVRPIDESGYFDFVSNTFLTPGQEADVPAVNVNTMGEVPDSSWFTNRIGRRPMGRAELVRGPDRFERLSIDGWPIVRDKGTGRQPGWRVRDPDGHIYQVEFDPPSNPEMATGAEIIGTAFYHAFGYNVVEVYLVEVDPDRLEIDAAATIRDVRGRRRRFTRADAADVLRQAARGPDGKYRALASRFADGEPLGHFRYHGTRPDDPNDVFPHEHRRELRGNRVFAAWLNHDDSRGINSLDMLETGPDGRKYVKHYMFDFGSILGSGTVFAQTPRAGNEYLIDWKKGFATLGTLGLYLRPWLTIRYPEVPRSVGRFEAESFDPETWRPEYPNPAFRNLQPADAFWAARIVSRFSDEDIRAIVEKAEYSDSLATDYVTATLIKRRDRVLGRWLNQMNPVDDIVVDPEGRLTFRNASEAVGAGPPATNYALQWYRFDNLTDTHAPVGGEEFVTEPAGQAPRELLSDAEFMAVRIRTFHLAHPAWARPATAYFRRVAGGWQPVGLERAQQMMPTRNSF